MTALLMAGICTIAEPVAAEPQTVDLPWNCPVVYVNPFTLAVTFHPECLGADPIGEN